MENTTSSPRVSLGWRLLILVPLAAGVVLGVISSRQTGAHVEIQLLTIANLFINVALIEWWDSACTSCCACSSSIRMSGQQLISGLISSERDPLGNAAVCNICITSCLPAIRQELLPITARLARL